MQRFIDLCQCESLFCFDFDVLTFSYLDEIFCFKKSSLERILKRIWRCKDLLICTQLCQCESLFFALICIFAYLHCLINAHNTGGVFGTVFVVIDKSSLLNRSGVSIFRPIGRQFHKQYRMGSFAAMLLLSSSGYSSSHLNFNLICLFVSLENLLLCFTSSQKLRIANTIYPSNVSTGQQ